ncbi:MAG: hypothetical protein AAF288_10185 [Planctomycetota bacterium]
MSKAIRLICPNLRCRAILAVPQTARGRAVRCRQCGFRVQVPSGAAKPAPSAENAAEGKPSATG